ncbi:hypothetical protein [Spiroplasma endosymbiont of Nebria brevicollis]|uniref:hypothetical protein n=1 Tax=Spiroplasma endosymbiont of Nebria brevicollis TaxID=3066284 RepID=UPI00313E23AA
MYRFRSIKYCSTTALVSALLAIFGFASYWTVGKWIAMSLNGGIIQLFDGLLIALTAFIPGIMLLISGIVAGILTDLMIASNFSFTMLPATVVIRILMFIIIRIFMNKHWYSCFWTFFIALLPIIIIYPLYTWVVYGSALAIIELLVDCVQCGLLYIIGIMLYWQLSRIKSRSNNFLWNDEEFNYLKKEQPRVVNE